MEDEEEIVVEAPRYFRAVLDADRVYWGVEEVASWTVGDVEVPEDCDLKPGHYQWDATGEKFVPLLREQRRDTPEAPSLERAFYALLKSFPDLPPHCQEWVQWFEKSFDALGRKS